MTDNIYAVKTKENQSNRNISIKGLQNIFRIIIKKAQMR